MEENKNGAEAQGQTGVVNKLVAKVCALLKIGDEGKVAAFFARQLRVLNQNLARAKRNVETLKEQKREALEELADKIEDATLAIEESFTAVDVDRIGNNANSDEFAVEYWSRISNWEATLEALQESKEEAIKNWDSKIKEAEETVAHLTKRIASIS